MMRRGRTPLLALLLALVGLLPAGAAGAASAAPPSLPQVGLPSGAQSCVASGKVWVLAINDRGATVASGCVSAGGSGKSVLKSVAPVVERATDAGFVCRIAGFPDLCIEGNQWNIDPRYWQYHHADPGGSWTYSNLGYTQRTPRPGSIEGWCLSAGPCARALTAALNPGSVAGYVPAPTRPATTIAPTTKAPTKPTTRAPTKAPTVAPTRAATTPAPTSSKVATRTTPARTPPTTATSTSAPPTSTDDPSTTAAAPSTAAGPTSPTSTPSAATSTSASSPQKPESSPTEILATPAAGGAGTPWGAVTTGGLVAAAAGAFLVIRHRRGATSEQ